MARLRCQVGGREYHLEGRVEGRTPHRARHAMGKHTMAKTGNLAAVQRQLGHRQAASAMPYARVTTEEVARV